ncbi:MULTISPECIES: hypothetical protein [unclassified Arsukibacterium]|uniref:hypothetical protein n=1 Tax=unclassified Arsukibacterium TaxID=2635278 RepID=UPI000C3F28CB|nr:MULTISPECIES: hypothetical protein [unclassified Arsukibacterium]MAA92911.1 hypothetical protein [Rheinheimera sp.]MBM34976.1 hypothetical protein [Rheinheimera sp.]HAW93272.1 hypothetical protein [Candidatus Azambacteria bacterium]|tara:strand:- start:1283 stop:1630 length:348 start_codon:yes stop_codon:yes gene_type:complete
MDHDVIQLEQQSLEALRHNYPQLQQLTGSIMFLAEAESAMLTATAWHLTDADNLMLRKLGVKTAILELLDTLVEQRKSQRIRPNREGRLLIDNGNLEIEWLTQGVTPLSVYAKAS